MVDMTEVPLPDGLDTETMIKARRTVEQRVADAEARQEILSMLGLESV